MWAGPKWDFQDEAWWNLFSDPDWDFYDSQVYFIDAVYKAVPLVRDQITSIVIRFSPNDREAPHRIAVMTNGGGIAVASTGEGAISRSYRYDTISGVWELFWHHGPDPDIPIAWTFAVCEPPSQEIQDVAKRALRDFAEMMGV